MPCLILIALVFPRLIILYLWFFTVAFRALFDTWIWPLLGFIFAPHTLLWYSAVQYWYGGIWSWWHYLVLVFTILWDIGSWNSTRSKSR